MSNVPCFECDACGERFGHLNELFPVTVRYLSGKYVEPTEGELHACLDCMPASVSSALDTTEWIGFPSPTPNMPAERVKLEGVSEPLDTTEVYSNSEPREEEYQEALDWVREWLVSPGTGGER